MLKDFNQYKEYMEAGKRIFFIGIGGSSMSGLAELSRARGQIVAGSDLHENSRTRDLEKGGIKVFVPQRRENIEEFKPDALVYSAAVPEKNPERQAGLALGIPAFERCDFLGLLNREFPEVGNIAGTNGKSTTTAMAAQIAMDAGLEPTVHLGAEFERFKSSVCVGGEKLMLSEACEFHHSFYSFRSTLACVLNIGHDHLDCFPTLDDVIDCFAEFLARSLETGGRLIVPAFDPHIETMLERFEEKDPEKAKSVELLSFGYPENRLRGKAPTLVCEDLSFPNGLPEFTAVLEDGEKAKVSLSVPGRFNVENALAALLITREFGASLEDGAESLKSFKGAEGRFTVCGRCNGALVVADYAHHPDSVKLTLEAAHALPHKTLYACFQPITYSRARGLCDGFVEALKNEDEALLLEVYDDREKDPFSSKEIAEKINEAGGNARFFKEKDALEQYLEERLEKEDLLLLMGQDIREIGDRLTKRSSHYAERPSLRDLVN